MLYTDRAHDFDAHRDAVRAKGGITLKFARRGTEHGTGLGVCRWGVERTISLLHGFRRLRTRWEVRDDIYQAWRRLKKHSLC